MLIHVHLNLTPPKRTFTKAMGEERAKPVRVEEAFEPHKVPHQRRYTETPFDAQHILMGEHHDFGPKRGTHAVLFRGVVVCVFC